MSVPMSQVLEFIKQHGGVVLVDWAVSPDRAKVCRAVFPTTLRRRPYNGMRSEFIRSAINHFYPHCCEKREMGTALYVKIENGREFLILESNLEPMTGVFDKAKQECPSYVKARKMSISTTFLGVPGINVQTKLQS